MTLNGFFGQDDLGRKHRKTYIKFQIAATIVPKYKKILEYFKQELRPELIRVPVLVVHSKADKYVFIKQSQDFFQQLVCPKRFIVLENATHGIASQTDRQRVVSEVDRWLG